MERKDLVYKDYKWTTKYPLDDPRVTGEPDSTILSRMEGYEVLYFINKCARKWKWQNHKQSCQKLERLIRLHLPSHIRSQKEIVEWIEAGNWKPHWDKL